MLETETQEEKNQKSKKQKAKGHKGLYKRGNIWWLRYEGVDGRIIGESSHFTKLKDAEDLLIERRKSVQDGEQPEGKRIKNHTFNELVKYISLLLLHF